MLPRRPGPALRAEGGPGRGGGLRRPGHRGPAGAPDDGVAAALSASTRDASREEFRPSDCHDSITAVTLAASGRSSRPRPGRPRRTPPSRRPPAGRRAGDPPQYWGESCPRARLGAGRAASRPNPSANSVGGHGRNGEPPRGVPRAHHARSSSPHGSPRALAAQPGSTGSAALHLTRPQSYAAPCAGRRCARITEHPHLMNLRTIASARPRPLHAVPAGAPARRVAGRRPALYLAVAAAGALMVNVLTAGEPAAHADAQPTSVSIAAQLGVPAAQAPAATAGRRPPAEQLAASRSERDADRAAAAQAPGRRRPGGGGRPGRRRGGRPRGRRAGRRSQAAEAAAAGRRRPQAAAAPAPGRHARPPPPAAAPARLLPGLRPEQARRRRQPVLLPREPVGQGERLEPERAEPEQHRLRDPAVPRLHLGRHRDRARRPTATGRSTPG